MARSCHVLVPAAPRKLVSDAHNAFNDCPSQFVPRKRCGEALQPVLQGDRRRPVQLVNADSYVKVCFIFDGNSARWTLNRADIGAMIMLVDDDISIDAKLFGVTNLADSSRRIMTRSYCLVLRIELA